MKRFFTLFLALCLWYSLPLWAQEETPASTDTTYWTNQLKVGFNFNQASFSDNWKAGGVNSIAFGSYLLGNASYEKGKVTWNNELDMQYGILKNAGQSMRKNIDRILFDSKVGIKASDTWNYFGGMNFLSQFYDGYQYGQDAAGNEEELLISKFLNPAFLMFSIGMEYKPSKHFWLRLSPLSPRFTFVTDTTIYRNVPTNYGVAIGERVRQEWLAASVLADFNKDIAENLNLKMRYAMYANYESFALDALDHRLDTIVTAKINKWVDVNLTAILLYDKDQDAKIQLSQALAIGLAYSIKNR